MQENPLLKLPSPILKQIARILPSFQADLPQSFFAVLSHRYEFADAAEALLSDLSLPNGTTISPAETVLFVTEGCVFDTGGDAGGEADGAERVGDRGRNVDFCWLDEAMLEIFAMKIGGRGRDRWSRN
jgi:hypothetical protein